MILNILKILVFTLFVNWSVSSQILAQVTDNKNTKKISIAISIAAAAIAGSVIVFL